MKAQSILAALLSVSLTVPCGARAPQVGEGEAMGTDPYVTEFQKEMASVKAAMVAMGVAIEAIQIPPVSKSAALAAKAAIVAEFAGMAGLEARAEAAKAKMIEHINGIKHDDGLTFGNTTKSVDFGAKRDDSSLKPKDDRTFRGAGPSQANETLHSASAPSSVRPALQRTNSGFSYNSAGGSPAVGFSAGMPMPTPGGAAPDTGAIGAGMPAAASITGGGAAGYSTGSGVGGGAAKSGASLGADANAGGANPDPKTLSHNTSDVAQKAEAAKKEAIEKKKADAEKKAEEEKQKKQQLQQMMMQGVTQAAQMVAQAAQATKAKDQKAEGQADSAAASATAP